jgi:hypothetical protein
VDAGSTFDRLPDNFLEFSASVLLITEMQGERGQRIGRIKFTRPEDESAYFEKERGIAGRPRDRHSHATGIDGFPVSISHRVAVANFVEHGNPPIHKGRKGFIP